MRKSRSGSAVPITLWMIMTFIKIIEHFLKSKIFLMKEMCHVENSYGRKKCCLPKNENLILWSNKFACAQWKNKEHIKLG